MSEAESSSPVEKADKRVLESRLEAYQATCHVQGSKLARIECMLFAESDQGKSGQAVELLSFNKLTFSDETLRAIANVLAEKGSNR